MSQCPVAAHQLLDLPLGLSTNDFLEVLDEGGPSLTLKERTGDKAV